MGTWLAVALGLGIFLFFWGLTRLRSADSEISARLGSYAARPGAAPEVKNPRAESALATGFEKAIAKQTFAQKIARDLARADLKLTVAEYLVLNALSTLFGGILGYVLGRGSLIFVLLGVVVGYFFPKYYVGRRQSARLKAFNDQLGDTITLLANSLRSGYSLLQGMDMVSREAGPPTSAEFGRVVREVGLGLSPEEALANLVRRINSEDLDLMVTAINVQHEVGGNLSQILETIGNTIRERVRIKGDIATLTAQQSVAAYVISAIPVLLAGVLYLINRDYMSAMFEGIFLCMPIGGLVLLFIGFMVIRKIVAIEV